MRTDLRGQAFVETAIGLFVFVFILAAMLTFGRIIPDLQRCRSSVRWRAGYNAQIAGAPFDSAVDYGMLDMLGGSSGLPVAALPEIPWSESPRAESFSYEVNIRADLGDFAASRVFGSDRFRVTSSVYLPGMSVPCAEGGAR